MTMKRGAWAGLTFPCNSHKVHFLVKGNGKGAVFNRAFQTPQENHLPPRATAGAAVFTSVAGCSYATCVSSLISQGLGPRGNIW